MKKTRLRALTYSDLPKTLKWHTQADIVEMYSGHPFPINEEMERQWYEKILYSNVPVTVFGIESTYDERLVGLSVLKDINFIHQKAELAIYIGDMEDRGKGFSKSALQNTLYFAFNKLGLNRVWLRVRKDNVPAISLYSKCGFKKEGVSKQAIFKNGVYIDEVMMAILKEEFEELLGEYEI